MVPELTVREEVGTSKFYVQRYRGLVNHMIGCTVKQRAEEWKMNVTV